MTRQEIFAAVEAERAYQDEKWGTAFDDKNTVNDWTSYIVKYLGQAVTMPWSSTAWRTQLIKVMALCSAALERDTYPPRHYD